MDVVGSALPGNSEQPIKTAVKAARLLSIGIGGDSHLRLNTDREILIGPQRVVPLSYLAHQHESVHTRLRARPPHLVGGQPRLAGILVPGARAARLQPG